MNFGPGGSSDVLCSGLQLEFRQFEAPECEFDACDWLEHFIATADLSGFDDAQKLVYARLHLEGEAFRWYRVHSQDIICFVDFERRFLQRFAPQGDSLAVAFDTIHQFIDEPVGDFIDRFWLTLDHLEQAHGSLPESVVVEHFLRGLLTDIRDLVISQHPQCMEDILDCVHYLDAHKTSFSFAAPSAQSYPDLCCLPASPAPYINTSGSDELPVDTRVALPPAPSPPRAVDHAAPDLTSTGISASDRAVWDNITIVRSLVNTLGKRHAVRCPEIYAMDANIAAEPVTPSMLSDDAHDMLQIAEVIAGLSAILDVDREHDASSTDLIAADLQDLKAEFDALVSPFKDCVIQIGHAAPQPAYLEPAAPLVQPDICTFSSDDDDNCSLQELHFVKTNPSEAGNLMLNEGTPFGYFSTCIIPEVHFMCPVPYAPLFLETLPAIEVSLVKGRVVIADELKPEPPQPPP